jgi:hypothetical protein
MDQPPFFSLLNINTSEQRKKIKRNISSENQGTKFSKREQTIQDASQKLLHNENGENYQLLGEPRSALAWEQTNNKVHSRGAWGVQVRSSGEFTGASPWSSVPQATLHLPRHYRLLSCDGLQESTPAQKPMLAARAVSRSGLEGVHPASAPESPQHKHTTNSVC